MRADYDLVVIGDSLSGRWAALYAARQYARVAFVQQGSLSAHSVVCQALSELLTHSVTQGYPFPFEDVNALRLWILRCAEEQLSSYALHRLAHHGVDILESPGTFIRSPNQAAVPVFESQGRSLRSRYYLLALDSAIACESASPHLPDISSLDGFLLSLESLPSGHPIFIHGQYPWAICLGQILNQLGYAITLFGKEEILCREDPEVSFLLQCQLEAEGIALEGKETPTLTLQSAILFRPVSYLPLNGLNLQNFGVQTIESHDSVNFQILVNSELETHNPKIFACGSILGGYALTTITQQEVALALDNLLFQSHYSLRYEQLAYTLPLIPSVSRIGLTEPQARQRFSHVKVLTHSIAGIRPCGSDLFFCKVIAMLTGEIIGIHLMGDAAHNSRSILEKIIREGVRVSELTRCFPEATQLQEAFQDFAYRWDTVQTPQKRDRLEQYFRAKRKQFS